MKTLKIFTAITIVVSAFILTGCYKSSLDKDGLTDDVRNIVPDDILEKLKDLGLPINGGIKPPNIEGTYLISPLILVKSNFSGDFSPGHQFGDGKYTFSQQNNSKLKVVCDYIQGSSQTGNGIGCFITGSGNKFSVWSEISGTHEGYPFKSIDVYSGEITSSGIKDFFCAFICTQEAPTTIKYGQGRLVYDSDGLSERIQTKSDNNIPLFNSIHKYDTSDISLLRQPSLNF